jgi:hypothetical protein
MAALGCGCEGDHLCLFHAKVRDYQIRAAGSEKAQRFLESLAKMPPEPPESPSEPPEGEPGEMTVSGYLDSDMDAHMPPERPDRLGHPTTWEMDSMADPGDSARPSDPSDEWVERISNEYLQAAREWLATGELWHVQRNEPGAVPELWTKDGQRVDDSAITGATNCPHCGEGLIKVRGMLICAGCDSIDVWPAMEGVHFYDQDADDA